MMSSPARSSVSATSAGQAGSSTNPPLPDDNFPLHFPSDLISPVDRKDEALLVLKSEVMGALQKEVKSLDEDSWKFSRPRSQIHLISRPGGLPLKQRETAEW
ncbi:valine-tRNA ligase [Tasmannia lanceolata]|uniref:valine-tRNA ligase n=1 Tax=Tasmannia lanceolata TaxID=3420 RepID=UPI0040635937